MIFACRNKSIFTLHLIEIFLVSFLTVSCIVNADAYDKNRMIKGTIVGIILTETVNGRSFLILRLDDGKSYRLKPEHGLGFIVGSDIELVTSNLFIEDEISFFEKKLVYVDSIKITALAIPGTNKKIKYPPAIPPEILIQSKEILHKIEQFKIEYKGAGSTRGKK